MAALAGMSITITEEFRRDFGCHLRRLLAACAFLSPSGKYCLRRSIDEPKPSPVPPAVDHRDKLVYFELIPLQTVRRLKPEGESAE
jgi:hypothetical protein